MKLPPIIQLWWDTVQLGIGQIRFGIEMYKDAYSKDKGDGSG
jgi:hypothetical protein